MSEEKHESYGMLDFSRVSSTGGQSLFGSSLVQQNFITLKISRASMKRKHSHNWYHPEELLIEVDLSPNQFIEAMTNMNTSGIPCTIKRVGKDRMEPCPHKDIKDTFHNELKADIQNILGRTQKLMKMVEQKLKAPGTISKKVRLEMAEELYRVEQDIRANLPYVYKQFNKQMDRSVTEAKSEIESFFTNTIYSLGSKELIKQMESGQVRNPMLEK